MSLDERQKTFIGYLLNLAIDSQRRFCPIDTIMGDEMTRHSGEGRNPEFPQYDTARDAGTGPA